MNLNEIQKLVVELQDARIWLKMSYKEKTLFSHSLKSYNGTSLVTMSSWTAPKASIIRADIKHLRAYKTAGFWFFFLHTHVN